MKKHNCKKCKFRAKYDNYPESFLGRLWRFHINFCPGWKSYMNSLPKEEMVEIAQLYNQKKFFR